MKTSSPAPGTSTDRAVAGSGGESSHRPPASTSSMGWIHASPRMAAQRQQITATFGAVTRRHGAPATGNGGSDPPHQLKAAGGPLQIGTAGPARSKQAAGSGVAQRIARDVGQAGASPVQSQADVLTADVAGDTLLWPSGAGVFNLDYAGSVQRAMQWGLEGGEGTSGWFGRQYPAAAFDAIGVAAATATNGLAPTPTTTTGCRATRW